MVSKILFSRRRGGNCPLFGNCPPPEASGQFPRIVLPGGNCPSRWELSIFFDFVDFANLKQKSTNSCLKVENFGNYPFFIRIIPNFVKFCQILSNFSKILGNFKTIGNCPLLGFFGRKKWTIPGIVRTIPPRLPPHCAGWVGDPIKIPNFRFFTQFT